MIQTYDFATPAGVIRMERHYTEINVRGPVADESWRFTDASGHEHAYADLPGGHYPTLREILQDPWYCHDCEETHEDMFDHYECALCGETIEPGGREPVNPVRLMLNRVSVTLDGEHISKERAEQILSDAMTAEKDDGMRHEIKLG